MDSSPQISGPSPTVPQSPAGSSLWDRMMNIFVAPGEVFDEVKVSRPTPRNWLVPVLVYGVVTALAAIVMMSQPAIRQQMREQQAKAMDDLVKKGKMTREAADKQMADVESFTGPILKVLSGIGGFMTSFAEVFWWAFVLWMIARFAFRSTPDFMKMTEVAGLASLIAILETTVRTLLVVMLANPLASPSLVLFLRNPNPTNPLVTLLALVNPLTFWLLGVRSIGLAKMSGVSTGKAAAWVVGVWLVFMAIICGGSIALMKMVQK